jgi:hypothetical protein
MRISRFVLAATLLAGSIELAAADTHRVVVLDFDGPRALADSSRDAVVKALGEEHDLVHPRRWTDARAKISRRTHGSSWWTKVSKQAGVDAVVEGWVQDEGRTKVLTVVVTDASAGKELDQLTIKLGTSGALTEANHKELRKGLGERFEWIASTNKVEIEDPKPKQKLGSEGPATPATPAQPAFGPQPAIGPQPARVHDPATEQAPTEPAPKDVALAPMLPSGRVDWVPPPAKPDSRETPRFAVSGGVGWRSRSLTIGAEFPEGVTQYAGVPDKFLAVSAAVYPFPWKKRDGQLSGVGFSFAIDQSIGSTVTFDDSETVGEYAIDQHGWNAAVHYRAPLSPYVTIDGEVGYGRRSYLLNDAPMSFEVPDTSYHFLHAGAHLDLSITGRASVGFGGRYFHVLDSGDLSSVEWYGPGRTSGLGIDGHFVVPLPAKMFVKGELAYTRFATSFDGVGVITEEEGVYEAKDSTVSGSVKVGIEF